MTRYFWGFANYPVGSQPADFTTLLRPQVHPVKALVGSVSGQVVEWVDAGGSWSVCSPDQVGVVVGAVDLYAVVTPLGSENSRSEEALYFGVSGGQATENGAVFRLFTSSFGTRRVDIHRKVNGAGTSLASTPYPWVIGTRYALRFNLQTSESGRDVRGKIWPFGEAEPEAWLLEAVGVANIGNGRVGFGAADSPVGASRRVEVFAIGTGVDTAPTTATGGGVNEPPIVDAGPDVADWPAGVPFSRTGLAEDPDGTITAREWKITAGPVDVGLVLSTGESFQRTFTLAGTYTLQHQATSSDAQTVVDTFQLGVVAVEHSGGLYGTADETFQARDREYR